MKSRKELSDVQFTYEELAVIHEVFGNTNGGCDGFPMKQRSNIFTKTHRVFNRYGVNYSLDLNDLNSCPTEFEKSVKSVLSMNGFDTPDTEVEEFTLAQVCEMLGKNIKIVKDN
jgi:hypothetical protein